MQYLMPEGYLPQKLPGLISKVLESPENRDHHLWEKEDRKVNKQLNNKWYPRLDPGISNVTYHILSRILTFMLPY